MHACKGVRACSLWEQALGPGGAARLPVPGTLRQRSQAEGGRERGGRLGVGRALWCALRVQCEREGGREGHCCVQAVLVVASGLLPQGLWSPGCVSWLGVCALLLWMVC